MSGMKQENQGDAKGAKEASKGEISSELLKAELTQNPGSIRADEAIKAVMEAKDRFPEALETMIPLPNGISIQARDYLAVVELARDNGLSDDALLNCIKGVDESGRVTKLVASGLDLQNISKLSNLSNLIELDLSNNSISDLSPLSELKNLTWLNIPNNQVSDINPLIRLTNLKSEIYTN